MELCRVELSRVAFAMKSALRPAQWATITVVSLVALRLVLAAVLPLSFDEAYYWLWSRRLSGGYYDHPPAVAFVIRLGTALAGDRELGVRLVSVLLALPMSWAVYQAAKTLFESERLAASATVFLNATLMVAGGTIIVTPDAPLMLAAALLLYGLAKFQKTQSGVWWLAVGTAGGVALLSKYNALFFGAAIVLWLTLVPELRRCLFTVWPYLGGAIAVALFSPVLLWNAQHDWASFHKQFGRVHVDEITLRYLVELLPAQVALATPFVFLLGATGLLAMLCGRGGDRPTRALLGLMIWPMVIYFAWHALHDRVQANWFAPVYPAFAIAAALAAENLAWQGGFARLMDFCRRWALLTGVAMFAIVGLQAGFGILPLGRNDPTGRMLAIGWPELSADIEGFRERLGATAIVTTSYAATAWLSYYLRKKTPVVQIEDRIRTNMLPVDSSALDRALYVVGPDADRGRVGMVRAHYRFFDEITELSRMRGGTVIETYRLNLVEGLIGSPLDPPH
jgi:4-amino-4-deoxy-L-arabinose transferase-like glycosyltransferase